MYVVSRYINGISINGKEFLLDGHGRIRKFKTTEDVLILLGAKDSIELEDLGIEIEEEE